MGALVFTAAERDKIKSTLDSVKSNGQALAAVDATLAMAEKLRLVLLRDGGAYREQAAKDIADYEKPLRDARGALAGSPTVAVGKTWNETKSRVSVLWYLVRTIEQGFPPGESVGDDFGTALYSSLVDLPQTIDSAAKVAVVVSKKVVNTAVGAVKEVGTAVGGAAGSIAWAAIKPLLPVILVVGIGAGAYFYAVKKGIL